MFYPTPDIKVIVNKFPCQAPKALLGKTLANIGDGNLLHCGEYMGQFVVDSFLGVP